MWEVGTNFAVGIDVAQFIFFVRLFEFNDKSLKTKNNFTVYIILL